MNFDKLVKIDGVKKQPLDERDHIFAPTKPRGMPSYYINPSLAEVENQLSIGSCTANAGCSSLEMMIREDSSLNLSRLFVYYNAREPYDNLKEVDSGAYVRDVYKSVNTQGVCSEKLWPYEVEQVNIKPAQENYDDAKSNKVISYQSIHNDSDYIENIKTALLAGNGIIYATPLVSTFSQMGKTFVTQTYRGTLDGEVTGHHAMSIVGYSDELDGFIIQNSWGEYFGENGRWISKYEDFKRDSYDTWTCSEFVIETDIDTDIDTDIEDEISFLQKIWNWIVSLFT